jgi:hypothetical protein
MEEGGMAISEEQWRVTRRLFSKTFLTSFHYAVATVNADGTPHVAPVGSLILRDNGRGFFFEEYLGATARNLQRDKCICVLAVHASRWLLLKSLLLGRFVSPPAIRLAGRVGDKREATPEELALFHRRVGRYHFLKGYDLLWSRLRYVRDVTFDTALPVRVGAMTSGLWPEGGPLLKSAS